MKWKFPRSWGRARSAGLARRQFVGVQWLVHRLLLLRDLLSGMSLFVDSTSQPLLRWLVPAQLVLQGGDLPPSTRTSLDNPLPVTYTSTGRYALPAHHVTHTLHCLLPDGTPP